MGLVLLLFAVLVAMVSRKFIGAFLSDVNNPCRMRASIKRMIAREFLMLIGITLVSLMIVLGLFVRNGILNRQANAMDKDIWVVKHIRFSNRDALATTTKLKEAEWIKRERLEAVLSTKRIWIIGAWAVLALMGIVLSVRLLLVGTRWAIRTLSVDAKDLAKELSRMPFMEDVGNRSSSLQQTVPSTKVDDPPAVAKDAAGSKRRSPEKVAAAFIAEGFDAKEAKDYMEENGIEKEFIEKVLEEIEKLKSVG